MNYVLLITLINCGTTQPVSLDCCHAGGVLVAGASRASYRTYVFRAGINCHVPVERLVSGGKHV